MLSGMKTNKNLNPLSSHSHRASNCQALQTWGSDIFHLNVRATQRQDSWSRMRDPTESVCKLHVPVQVLIPKPPLKLRISGLASAS